MKGQTCIVYTSYLITCNDMLFADEDSARQIVTWAVSDCMGEVQE